jgi:hypothetical protein
MGKAGVTDWLTGTWAEPLRRFHGFDSMLLTVSLVPSVLPYSGRDVLMDPFIRGFVPRVLYSGKSVADEGVRFGSRIWAYDNPESRELSGASIAPSMPGDLFESGGIWVVAAGSLIWGTLLGFIDGWKRHLPAFCAATITVLLATQCAMSVERDFDHTVATFLQTLLVFVFAAGLVAVSRRRAAPFGPLLKHSVERP